MGRPSRRGELLDAGVDILHRRGYAAASVESIAEAAGVPKGALFNHFGTKELFTNEALRSYFRPWSETTSLILDDPDMNAAAKLRAMISAATESGKDSSYGYGCMIGNLAAELAGEHESIRLTIADIFVDWVAPFQKVISEGQKSGELRAGLQPNIAARFIVNSLQGALLRCKVDRTPTPLNDFNEVVFGLLMPENQKVIAANSRPRDVRKKHRR